MLILIMHVLYSQKGLHPLHAASFNGNFECVELLLNHNAQIDLPANVSYHCKHVLPVLTSYAHDCLSHVRMYTINIHVCNSCRMTLGSQRWELPLKKAV